MANEIVMTKEGYDDLVKELAELKTTRRAEISEKIRIARGFGDLSENSEYDEAKNEQAIVEARILTPVGKALLGHKAGDAVYVTIPSGEQIEYQIIKVE